jgi:hypothetical protein
MKFNILTEYNEMENDGLMIADVLTDSGVKALQIEHTDLMGGFDQINGNINLEALALVLVDIAKMITDKGADFYGYLDIEVNGDTITFTDDTEPFAELQGKQAFILDKEQLPFALCGLSSYFWENA